MVVDGVVAKESGIAAADANNQSHSMPGILPRPESIPKASTGTKMASDAQVGDSLTGTIREVRPEARRNGDLLMNGNRAYSNGVHANGVPATPTDVQYKTSTAIDMLVGQLPPELEHITIGYTPFSILISRLVQETFVGLTEAIDELSETSVPSGGQHPPSNHPIQHTNLNGEVSGGNVRKKLRMLSFTSDRRAQFIKILILLRWARQGEAVSKVIDLNVWTHRRLQEFKDCISWIGELKRILAPLRDPNPDIKTALEVLSLASVSCLPDHGYIPPAPLSPHQLLKTLRKINTLLSIRLNLYEVIPPALREFEVASGRATFRVPEEFEVELSIAEENPSSQLYFIDFRFIFVPTPPDLPVGRLQDEIEGRANDVLKKEGLSGLFGLLHNLTLTHKLTILRNQANEMARDYYSEQLKVETVHRSFVVQYWLNKSGGKSWVEIGLRKGKRTSTSYAVDSRHTSYIGIRWFRDGKEVLDHQITIRLDNLSFANILKQVTAQHTSYIFEQITVRLGESLLYSDGCLRLRNKASAMEPMDASLFVQLTTSKAIKIIQEPTSGKFSILPASQSSSRAEYELNRTASPTAEGASCLAQLRSFVSQEEADMGARNIGWEPIRFFNPSQETLQKLFGKGTQYRKFFKRSAWSSNWMLGFTASQEGDFWWIVELTDTKARSDPAFSSITAGPTLYSAFKIPLAKTKSRVIDPSYATLAQIEDTAACMISHFVDTRALLPVEYPHKVHSARRDREDIQKGRILIRMPSKTVPSTVRLSLLSSLPWLEEVVRLDYCGLNPSRSFALHVACVQVQQNITGLHDLLSAIPFISFQPAYEQFPATIKFQFRARVGESVVPNLRGRLKAVELFLDFASALQSYNLSCSVASLTRLVFKYATSNNSPGATIHFPEDAPKHISLSKLNPHLRVVDHLTEQIRSNGLPFVIGILRVTLSLLRAFSVIEAGQNGAGVDILTRSDQWYQVRYSEPYSKASFDIRLQSRRDDAMWFIPESSVRKPESADEVFEQELKTVMRGKGDGWWGVKGGMIAHVKGVGNLIVKLNEVFRKTTHVSENSNPRKRKADADEIVEID